jgi:hypothetical protein
MPFEKTYNVTSTRFPEKVYASVEEFWADCEPEVTDAANANAAYKADGKILATTSTLNEDGLSLTYVKEFFDEESYNEYNTEHASAITANLTVCSFTSI